MKIENIKTKDQFWVFADVWYQRTIRLAVIMGDENINLEKRNKAGYLWFIMMKRMEKIIPTAIKLNTFIPSPKFNKGGV